MAPALPPLRQPQRAARRDGGQQEHSANGSSDDSHSRRAVIGGLEGHRGGGRDLPGVVRLPQRGCCGRGGVRRLRCERYSELLRRWHSQLDAEVSGEAPSEFYQEQ